MKFDAVGRGTLLIVREPIEETDTDNLNPIPFLQERFGLLS